MIQNNVASCSTQLHANYELIMSKLVEAGLSAIKVIGQPWRKMRKDLRKGVIPS